jgi:hypothetical protein
VKERGIIFSAPMVRALLEGRKTQTRRVIPDGGRCLDLDDDAEDRYHAGTWGEEKYGHPGERLWVRETWAPDPVYEDERRVCYRATAADESCIRWKPSIFMPRWASRITLEVTEVRVQRLQDISEEDARAEGVAEGRIPADGQDDGRCVLHPTRRRAFEVGWDSINGDRAPWASNPWVWAISFRRLP